MLAFIVALLIGLFPSCATEDSTMCYWDASTHNNGQGSSFIALSEDVVITFNR